MDKDLDNGNFILNPLELHVLSLNQESRIWPMTAVNGLVKAVELSRDRIASIDVTTALPGPQRHLWNTKIQQHQNVLRNIMNDAAPHAGLSEEELDKFFD